MTLEELMADEVEEIQDASVLTYAGAQMISPRSSAPRELEFRREETCSGYRAQRMDARKRRAMNCQ